MNKIFKYIIEFYGIEEDMPKVIRERLLISMKISILEVFTFFVIFLFLGRNFGQSLMNSVGISFVFSIVLFTFSRVFNLGAIHSQAGLVIVLIFSFFKVIIISLGTMILIFENEIDENFYNTYMLQKMRYEEISSVKYPLEFENESILNTIKELNEIVFGPRGNIYFQSFYYLVFSLYFGLTLFPLILIYDRKNLLANFNELRDENINAQLKIFSSIQHELGNKLPATKQEIKFLFEIFENRSAKGEGVKVSDIVREPLPGEELYSIDSVKDLFVRSLNKLDYSLNVVQQLGDVLKADPSKLKLEPVDLVEFLRFEIPKYSTSDNRVSVEIIDEKNLFIDIDKTQFGFLLNNLVSNAIKHGISENYPELKIKFLVHIRGKYIHLLIMNDGCPMDPSITFEKFITPFFHFGRTGNSGLGGYIINTIVKNHNASFTLNSTVIGSDKFKTVFDFKFKESNKK